MADDQDPIDELLGAYALDAVDEHERRQVEAYLDANPRARAEVAAHREVAALLTSGEQPPVGGWERIAAALGDRPTDAGPVPVSSRPARRQTRRRVLLAGVAAAGAAAAAVVITVAIVDDGGGGARGDDAIEQAFSEAWTDPDGRHARLRSDDEALQADAVVGPNGAGFLSAGDLPALPSTETYQLWGVYADGDVISLGVIGRRPDVEPFTAEGDIEAVVITRERAGGVESSTSSALLVGELS